MGRLRPKMTKWLAPELTQDSPPGLSDHPGYFGKVGSGQTFVLVNLSSKGVGGGAVHDWCSMGGECRKPSSIKQMWKLRPMEGNWVPKFAQWGVPNLSLQSGGGKVEVLKGAFKAEAWGVDRMFLHRQASCQEHASVPMEGHHQGQEAQWGRSSAHGHQRRPESASSLGWPQWWGALGHLHWAHTDRGGCLHPRRTQSRWVLPSAPQRGGGVSSHWAPFTQLSAHSCIPRWVSTFCVPASNYCLCNLQSVL